LWQVILDIKGLHTTLTEEAKIVRTERIMAFSRLEGIVLKYGIPVTDKSLVTLKTLETKVRNMTSEQIELIQTFVEQLLAAHKEVLKAEILKAVSEL
jgi:hypothetical protein